MARSDIITTYRRIRRQMGSAHRNEFGVLDTAMDLDDTAVVFDGTPPRNVVAGTMLGIDLEMMRVVSVAGSTATVLRGWADSEAATHAVDTEIAINPRFSLLDIAEAAIAEVDSWGPKLWRSESQVLAAAEAAETVELPAEWLDMYYVTGVRRFIAESDDTTKWPTMDYSLSRHGVGVIDSALTSGMLLRLPGWCSAGSVVVEAALPLTIRDYPLSSDLIDDCGFAPGMIDLLELGVKMRLMADGEIGRSSRQVQGDSRLAQENPVGSMVPVLQLYQRQYDRKMAMEQQRLYARHPLRMA